MKSNKGQGISISTLVIIALAVFVLFLVIGFVTTGWGFFTGQFEIARQEPMEIARTRCLDQVSRWQGAGSPRFVENDYRHDQLCGIRSLDLTGDGVANNYTCCSTGVDGVDSMYEQILSAFECQGAQNYCDTDD